MAYFGVAVTSFSFKFDLSWTELTGLHSMTCPYNFTSIYVR